MAAIVAALPLVSPAQSTLANPFGSLPNSAWANGTPNHNVNTAGRIATVQNLGIPYVRASFKNIDANYDFATHGWKSGADADWIRYQDFASAGCKMLVNFNWQGGPGSVYPAGASLTDYLTALDDILTDIEGLGSTTRIPRLVVIENEEANLTYYANTVNREDYLDQLAAAITLAHNHGLLITNGGFTEKFFNVYVWDYYLNVVHDTAKADSFKSRALGTAAFSDYANNILTTTNQQRLAIAQLLMNGSTGHPGYKDLPIDYLNIHWYLAPGEVAADALAVLQEVVDVLATVTGKTVLSNEMGARTNGLNDPLPAGTIAAIMTTFHRTLMMPYVIGYSGPSNDDAPYPVALSNQDGTLTSTSPNDYGTQFRAYITASFDDVFQNPYWDPTTLTPANPLSLSSQPVTAVIAAGGSTTFTAGVNSGAKGRTPPAPSSSAMPVTLVTKLAFSEGVEKGRARPPGAPEEVRISETFPAGPAVPPYPQTGFFDALSGSPPTNAKAGLMLRESNQADSRYVRVGVTGDGNTRFQVRANTGGGTTADQVDGVVATWVKLEWDKSGNVHTYYATGAATPTSWTAIGTLPNFTWPAPLVGLAVSGSTTTQATASFSNVSLN